MPKKQRYIGRTVALTLFALILFSGALYHQNIYDWFAQKGESPTLSVSATPAPVTSDGITTITLPKEIAPEPIPVVYSDTFEEARVQSYLKEGAVILPLGAQLGEVGNVVITAHSSGFPSYGPYRFAFTKLENIKDGEEFIVKTPEADYTYRVYGREIVWPSQIDKLPKDSRSTVTLVTCWPNWTNLKRLLINSELVKTEPRKQLTSN